jgi:rhodanese-related sulfurtransferase/rubrerythrin
MNWNSLVGKEQTITPAEAKRLMDAEAVDKYQMLDVRQPKEYEQSHIPGATLIPLSDLIYNLSLLDKNNPVIVYCRSGVRSKAGCQILAQAGFSNCFNMSGGILKWNGAEAAGDEQFGLEYFVNGDFSSTFTMAYQMELNLKKFYLLLSEDCSSDAEKEMLSQMALFEDGHMAKLQSRYKNQYDSSAPLEKSPGVLEGGIDPDEMRSALAGQLGSQENVLQLAMKLEAQALDLYSRLAREHKGDEIALFFNEMAHEEQAHLQRLSKQLDKILEN